jgi:hypothetical protein
VALDSANTIVATCRHERERKQFRFWMEWIEAYRGTCGRRRCLRSGGILRSRPILPDLAKLSEDELIELNRRIVERCSCCVPPRVSRNLAKFSVGMVVEFDADDGRTLKRDHRASDSTNRDRGHRIGAWASQPRAPATRKDV